MTGKQLGKAAVAFAVVAAINLTAMWLGTSKGHAQDRRSDDEWKIRKGLEIAPVPLNMHGKNPELVGLGSYLVNGDGDCNGCHSAGPPTQFTPDGNPYQLAPPFGGIKKVNPATYLGGGRNFGPLIPGSASIISRNLTPDKTGMPVGGRPFSDFVYIMRTGMDLDKLHPQCPAGSPDISCLPAPFNGALLQVMPWPDFQNLTDQDLRAIYEYLSALPCVAGPSDPKNPLHNTCS